MTEPFFRNFKESLSRFKAHYTKETGTWRLYDMWHDAMQQYRSMDDEIPDTCPAVTVIPELGFLELVQEAKRIGLFDKTGVANSNDEDVFQLKEKIAALEAKPKRELSEAFLTREKAIDAVLKLAGMGEIHSEKE